MSSPAPKPRRRNRSEVSDSGSSVIGAGIHTQSPGPPRSNASSSSASRPDYSQLDMLHSDDLDEESDHSGSPPRSKRRIEKEMTMSEDEEQETIEEKDEQEGGVNDSDLDLLDDEEDQPQQMTEDHADGASDVEMVDEGIRPEYERDDDGFVKGSIVRLKVVNFMTYRAVTAFMGPHLNMILGPNGTGKSSIAAALAIGLGFHPNVMGRAPDLRSYVQQGCEEAQIEVELKGGRGGRNTVLHCTFERESDRSAWRINGETAKKKEVEKVVASFGIQANNLCCFLPQDKVAEFARLPPEGVLSETMRAAGDPRLSNWHKYLTDEGKKSRATREVLEKDTAEHGRLKTYVDGMKGEVESFERRKQLTRDRDIANLTLIMLDSRKAAIALTTAEKEQEALEKNRDSYGRIRKPIMDLSRHQQDKLNKSVRTRQIAEDDGSRARKKVEKHVKNISTLQDEVEEAVDERSRIKKTITRIKEQRQKYERDRLKAQAILDEPVEEGLKEKFEVLKKEKRSYQERMRRCEAKTSERKAEHDALTRRIERANNDLRNLQNDKDRLSSVEKQREQDARKWDPSLNFALSWLEQNESRFEEPIIRPACMSVNVKDKRFVKQLENCTNAAQRKTFIATNEKDFDLLLDLSKMALPGAGGKTVALHFILIKMDENSLKQRRPCSNETLQALGFEGFAIDYVAAPNPMMAFLIRIGMSSTAITDRASSQINDNAAIQAGLMSWVCRDDVSQSVRSAYGRRDVQTTTRRANEPRSWLITIDREAISRIGDQMGTIKREKGDMEKELPILNAQHDDLRDEMKDIEEKHDAINAQMEQVIKKHKDRVSAEANVKKYEELLAKDDIGHLERQRARLGEKTKDNVHSRLPLLKACVEACDPVFESPSELIAATLLNAVANENLKLIQDKSQEGLEEYEAAKKLVKAHNAEVQKLDKKRQEALQLVDATIASASRDTQKWFNAIKPNSFGQVNYEDVRDQLEDAEHELSISEGINPDVIEKYEKAVADMKRMVAAVQKATVALKDLQTKIESTLKQFNPALEALIRVVNEKFSQAFALVGCTGEVRLNRSYEDFGKWGIEIAVSYRDSDPLAILTASRQSGGERSLATITYLMSLTEMARTPFSLVDEINQGMDQRAERNVHNQLVKVTNGQHAGQYFLITPKLLTNLDYHEKMRVLTVFNGVHMPSGEVKKGKLRLTDLKSVIRATAKSVQAGHIAVR